MAALCRRLSGVVYTLADVQNSGCWESCQSVEVSPPGSTGGGSAGNFLAERDHPSPDRTDLTPEKRQAVQSSEPSLPRPPVLLISPSLKLRLCSSVLYVISLRSHARTYPACELTRQFSQFSWSLSSHLCPSSSRLLLLPLSKQMSPLSLRCSSSSDGPLIILLKKKR